MSTAQSPITSYQSPKWPLAAPFRGSAINLNAVIEAEFTGAHLRELAKWLNVTPKGTSRLALVDQVVVALSERAAKLAESSDALFEGLNPEQQDFARRLLTARDHQLPIPRAVAAAVWGRVTDDRRLGEMIESLRRRALLFPTHAFLPSSYRDVYYQWLPLNGYVPVMMWEAGVEMSDRRSPSQVALVQSQFLEDFDVFLNAILQNGATLRAPLPQHRQSPKLTWLRDWEHDAEEAERVLRSRSNWAPDPTTGISVPLLSPFVPQTASALENQTGLSAAHIEFHFAIACALQLIEAPDPATSSGQVPGIRTVRHVRARTSAVEEWLVMTGEHKLRRAWKAWSEEIMPALEARTAMGLLKANDTFRIMRAIGARDLTPAVLAAEWCALRRYAMRVLRGLPAGKWVRWDELARQLFEFYPDCAWTFVTRAEWWFALASTGARINPNRAEEWHASIGLVLKHIVRDSLAWFGTVEVREAEGAFDAFRITPLGEVLLGLRSGDIPSGSAPLQRAIEPIAWLDKHTLRVPPAPDRASFIGLVRQVAERGAEPFTFAFTPASIERALTNGVAVDDVTAQFKHMKVTLPKAIAEQFRQIARRFGRIRVYQSLTVLELSDDFVARELMASTSLAQRVIYQLSPRAFALPDDDVDALIEEMQEKGYTPRVK